MNNMQDSLIDKILNTCKNRYNNVKNIKDNQCPRNIDYACGECLKNIHFPNNLDTSQNRDYDCTIMADFYVCRYALKYTSEIVHILKAIKLIKNERSVNVLSFGCGPCTDLFAFEYLKKNNELHYDKLKYFGIDYKPGVWKAIHEDINQYQEDSLSVKFYYKDIIDTIDELSQLDWTPNIIFFQYVFSDMQKHSGTESTTDFVRRFSKYFNEKSKPNSLIIINDINLSTSLKGGREYFDLLVNSIKSCNKSHFHFYDENSSYPGGYSYGTPITGNNIIFNIDNYYSDGDIETFTPYNKCSSAAMIIKKCDTE